MEPSEIEDAAMFLLHLHTQNDQVTGLPGELAPKTVDEGYDIQDALHRFGGWPIGLIKVGCTSEFAQEFLGIPHPAAGRIPADAVHQSGATIDAGELGVLPLLECEFALRVDGDGQVDAVAPALELVGGRFKAGAKVSGPTIIADNVSGRAVVLGEAIPIDDAGDLLSAEIELSDGTSTIATGTGAAVIGGPRASLDWTLNHEESRGRSVDAGTWVITGTCTGLVPSEAGTTYTASFGPLGTVSFTLA